MGEVKILLPVKVTSKLSLNKIYSGVHWSVRCKYAEQFHTMVQMELLKQGIYRGSYIGAVEVRFKFNSNLDIDNHGYIIKMVIDGLKGYLIQDDNKKYVKKSSQEFDDKIDGIEVTILKYQ